MPHKLTLSTVTLESRQEMTTNSWNSNATPREEIPASIQEVVMCNSESGYELVDGEMKWMASAASNDDVLDGKSERCDRRPNLFSSTC
ncbi:hypothetical protein KIN20_026994 [Parelaphostrongylus tenuis]|uniref:Uncharacterized protein n=1 Tax=Parelaphostrongylus tenuis TaxID=148309 RepID=A0AAD5QYR5_PARTN|nr:hypothetical protein KIN20_026994 [Parelaphostrongylus tenuis]